MRKNKKRTNPYRHWPSSDSSKGQRSGVALQFPLGCRGMRAKDISFWNEITLGRRSAAFLTIQDRAPLHVRFVFRFDGLDCSLGLFHASRIAHCEFLPVKVYTTNPLLKMLESTDMGWISIAIIFAYEAILALVPIAIATAIVIYVVKRSRLLRGAR